MPTLVVPFPAINPILFEWGPLAIRWYALAYIAGLIAGWALIRRYVVDDRLWGGAPRPSRDSIDDLLVYCAFGVVIVTSTRALLGHSAGYTAYCSSKGAENLLTRCLAAEWGSKQIRVNAVAPTVFRSDLTAWMYGDDEHATKTREGMLSRIPLGRLAEPDDVVGPTLFLLSDLARFCTGQILYVDGGYTAC